MMIIPPQLSLYLSLAPEAKLTYPLAGPAGSAAFNAGVQGFEAQSFRGLGVFTSTPVSHCQEHSHIFSIALRSSMVERTSFQAVGQQLLSAHQISHGAAPCSHSQYEVSDGARLSKRDDDKLQYTQQCTPHNSSI